MLNDRQLSELFATARQGFRNLLRQEVITCEDLAVLSPQERYAITLEFWKLCNEQAPSDKIRTLALTNQRSSIHSRRNTWPLRPAIDQIQGERDGDSAAIYV